MSQGYIDGLVAQLHRENLAGFFLQSVKKCRIDRGGFLAHKAGEGSAFCAVSFACRAEAAERLTFSAVAWSS